jgi:hypothetical protein
LWEEKGATGPHRFSRSAVDSWHDDDAAQITPEILKGLKSERFKNIEVFDVYEFDEYYVDELDESSVGGWLVVIDYSA